MTAHSPTAHPGTERSPLRQVLLILVIGTLTIGVLTAAGWLLFGEGFLSRPTTWFAQAVSAALVITLAVATHARHTVAALRAELAERERRAQHFAGHTVPALAARLRTGTSAATALATAETPADDAHRRVMTLLAEEISRSETSKAAAMAACANAAGRMQALATSMLADLREMEHRHTDEAVLGDLLHLDHRTAQAGRLADSIAVLTGARSGRRWAKPIVMESILRGAMGRIGGYQRVRLHSASRLSVAGHAAEGVMHALAELLDNAANFSPPTAEVHVYVEEVPSGVIITVEDSGLVMSEVALRRAERAVSAAPLDLTALSGTRLGLAVVGALARKHGMSVSFRPSARGGTGALMMIPQELISRPKPDAAPAVAPPEPVTTGSGRTRGGRTERPALREVTAVPAPTAEHAPAGQEPEDAPAPPDGTEYGESGLPKRRRGRTLAAAHTDHDPPTRKLRPRANHSPAESAARFGTFRRAVRGETPAAKDAPARDRAPGRDAQGTGPAAGDDTGPGADTQTLQPEDENR
ncbi:sensor histidine kinase [Streptomyces sp. XC 2026]|uniref:sensor histidine kinase n=1 Tax=Streptomyces sp. XC 2026 TaxID=2782004 RepID=UPI001F3E7080|nr:ATP-binding protein [Streptomyces sp. XC 2026]